jgi:hypothetical protein
MKRMICFISQQPLPNFIPINEPATRPDALHAIFTPKSLLIKNRWNDLRTILSERFPTLELHDLEIEDEFDAQATKHLCENLLLKYPDDHWSLNMTGGTKLMSSPAVAVFQQYDKEIYYVESPKNRTLNISLDWQVTPIPFTESVDVQTYFAIYGRSISLDNPVSGQEQAVFNQLKALDWRVWSSVTLLHKENNKVHKLAEYDVIGILHYQLFHFECKRLSERTEEANEYVWKDLYKLYQVQQHFGGPFGKSYWIFSGDHQLHDANRERLRDFRITLIRGSDINQISKTPEKFGLPNRKPKN